MCMSISTDMCLYAVGSQSHVTLVDPRNTKDQKTIISEQRGSGMYRKDLFVQSRFLIQ